MAGRRATGTWWWMVEDIPFMVVVKAPVTGGLEMPETLVDVRERKEDWRDFIDIHECVICV